MEAYQYNSLPSPNPSEPYIRLIELPPSGETGSISCIIRPFPLAQAPEYEAVSYCWGDDKTDIQCNGKLLRIPKGLYAFLLCMGGKGKRRTLWADAICINQGDRQEKTEQVKLMRDIYRRATRTLIWLGTEYDDSSRALDFAVELSRAASGQKPTRKATRWQLPGYLKLSAIFGRDWMAFFALFQRPWFSRAWIIQEVALTSQPWVICGDKAIHWNSLVEAFVHTIVSEAWTLEFFGCHEINYMLSTLTSRSEVFGGLHKKHYEVLLRHRKFQTSEPRDHIFAFYGMSCLESFKEYGIEPDYHLSVEETFRDFASRTLKKSSDLDFLSIPRLYASSKLLNLPSWVPDWTQSGRDCLSLLQCETIASVPPLADLYDATTGSIYQPIIDQKKGTLELYGYDIDRISTLSDEWEVQDIRGIPSIRQQAKTLWKNQRLVFNWANILDMWSDEKYLTGEAVQEAVCQTLTAGDFTHTKAAALDAFRGFQKRQRYIWVLVKLHLQDSLWAWVIVVLIGHALLLLGIPNPEMPFRYITSAMVSRRCMKTASGHIGLAPGIAQVGDRIALFKGGRLPLVIRPCGTEWELIGDSYMHGVMRGEAWREDPARCEKFRIV